MSTTAPKERSSGRALSLEKLQWNRHPEVLRDEPCNLWGKNVLEGGHHRL